MGNDIVQANYEELDDIAAQFKHQAEANAELHSRLQNSFQPLQQGEWIGLGADAFFDEMTGEVFPAMQRLTEALAQAQSVTLEISAILQEAEEEAASPFHNGAGGFITPGAAGKGATAGAFFGDTRLAGIDTSFPEPYGAGFMFPDIMGPTGSYYSPIPPSPLNGTGAIQPTWPAISTGFVPNTGGTPPGVMPVIPNSPVFLNPGLGPMGHLGF